MHCILRYRYTLGQLKGLLEKLHELINPMKEWEKQAKKVLKRGADSKEKEGELHRRLIGRVSQKSD